VSGHRTIRAIWRADPVAFERYRTVLATAPVPAWQLDLRGPGSPAGSRKSR